MTAYNLFEQILDINETLEVIKNRNTEYNADSCDYTIIQLLENYRDVLFDELKHVQVFDRSSYYDNK